MREKQVMVSGFSLVFTLARIRRNMVYVVIYISVCLAISTMKDLVGINRS